MSCVDAAGGVYMEDLHHSVLDIWLIYDWESLNEEREELERCFAISNAQTSLCDSSTECTKCEVDALAWKVEEVPHIK